MKHPVMHSRFSSRLQRQRGVVLYIALAVMVVMMLAGVAVLRSVGTGQGVSGNLAFKQNATSAGDRGVVAALTYLRPAAPAPAPTTGELAADQPNRGYFASWNAAFDPTTYDWDANTSAAGPVLEAVADDGTRNRVRYLIHRMCNTAGPLEPPNVCVSVVGANTLNTGISGGLSGPGGTVLPAYFRITTRVDGPRNTVSYTQVVVQ
jgi:Tfp pilus assembly protein PilX